MVEILPIPAFLAMADSTCLGISGSRMLLLVVRLVTGRTVLRTGRFKKKPTALNMAGVALGLLVGTLKSKTSREGGMIKGSDFHPGSGRMAGQAFGGKAQGCMVNLFWGFVVIPVARQTFGGEWTEASADIIRMAALTADLEVGTLEGETSGQVNPNARHILKSGWCMAEATVGG